MANSWTGFGTFQDYYSWFSKQTPISSKIGVFSPNDHSFFTANGLFFHNFFGAVPPKTVEYCPVGKMGKYRIHLDPSLLFAPPAGIKRQGDFYQHSEAFPVLKPASPDYWIVLSHSCSMPKTGFVPFAPIYKSTTFRNVLKDIDPRDWASADFDNLVLNIESNKLQRFLPFPKPPSFEEQDTYENLIADLDQIYSLPSATFHKQAPALSLTFEGLSYLQCRMAIRFCRDLRLDQWDDQRALGHEKR